MLQSKRDLGFVEGDLIECLNAGDGSWWMGRLRRDKRVMGLFPSNFVQVLDDNFKPASRVCSPMPEQTPSPTQLHQLPTQKTKPKACRKPFQSYAAPDPAVANRANIEERNSTILTSIQSRSPRTSNDSLSRAPSVQAHVAQDERYQAQQRGYRSQAASPMPMRNNSYSPCPSPLPPMHNGPYASRAPSPAHDQVSERYALPGPLDRRYTYSREPSPDLGRAGGSSPPPPAPPPHRSLVTSQVQDPRQEMSNGYHTPRPASAAPLSPGGGHTPSPLRDAMDDVMSSLADMGITRDTESPELDPWTAERQRTNTQLQGITAGRPNTSMGLGGQSGYEVDTDELHFGTPLSNNTLAHSPPKLSHYVQRMESRLNKMHKSTALPGRDTSSTKVVTNRSGLERPQSSMSGSIQAEPKLRHRKSAYEISRSVLGRTFTTKTNSTSASSGTRSTTTNASSMTEHSLMSGPSASGFSSTSAGSLARKKQTSHIRAQSALGLRRADHGSFDDRPASPLTGVSYHSSHASEQPRAQSQAGHYDNAVGTKNGLGGLVAPKARRSGFFKKMIETARTGAASARSSIAAAELPKLTSQSRASTGFSAVPQNASAKPSQRSDMGLGGNSGYDWVQVRRDVNRSNSLSHIEMVERKERCQMMDYPAISPIEELFDGCAADEAMDGRPILDPVNFQAVNFNLVDKNARFINSLPPMTNPISLATGFICRPYRSDVQRLRAIFIWVSEKLTWEESFECEGDLRKTLQTKRACPEEAAVLVMELCAAVGIHAEVVKGYLKTPGEIPELGITPRSNHYWNAVVVDGEWRMLDCSLASPSHPRRAQYSSHGGQQAEAWWFLARPMEMCWTHVPERHDQQHICPPVAQEILLALPSACPSYFKNNLHLLDYNTSSIRIEDLEQVHVKMIVPEDIECVAEVEARAFERDADGDLFENGETVKKRALAQVEWIGGQKRYTIKALLPGDEGCGTLKIYAGRRGLMHSIRDVPHPLALALPIMHTGDNPPYDFITRHPTPHAQRHDLYVAQPQCQRLAVNHTFVFAIRQHPSSSTNSLPTNGSTSPIPPMRPGSALSFTNSSASGSDPSTRDAYSSKKPAKLAIQAPSGKVIRLMRKDDKLQTTSHGIEVGDGGTWETVIKCGETGTWRGLVLADRSARWAVFAEWTCV